MALGFRSLLPGLLSAGWSLLRRGGWRLLGIYALCQALPLALVSPVIHWMFTEALASAGAHAVDSAALAGLLASRVSVAWIVGLCALALITVSLQLSLLVVAAGQVRTGGSLAPSVLLRRIRPALRRLLSPGALPLGLYLFFVVPLTQAGFFSVLTQSIAVPNFVSGELLKSTQGTVAYISFLVILGTLALRFSLAVPLFALGGASGGRAMRLSWRATGRTTPALLAGGAAAVAGGLLSGVFLVVLALLPTLVADLVLPEAAAGVAAFSLGAAQVAGVIIAGSLVNFVAGMLLELAERSLPLLPEDIQQCWRDGAGAGAAGAGSETGAGAESAAGAGAGARVGAGSETGAGVGAAGAGGSGESAGGSGEGAGPGAHAGAGDGLPDVPDVSRVSGSTPTTGASGAGVPGVPSLTSTAGASGAGVPGWVGAASTGSALRSWVAPKAAGQSAVAVNAAAKNSLAGPPAVNQVPQLPPGSRRRRYGVRAAVGGAVVVPVLILGALNLPVMEGLRGVPDSLVLGHRGFSAGGVENTISGLRAAEAVGADLVEMDVMQTSDGQFIAMHDSSLQRLSGIDAAVGDLTLAELTSMTVQDQFGHSDSIPSLSEYVRAAQEIGEPLLIELKLHGGETDDYVEALVAELESLDALQENIYHSLSQEKAEELKLLRPSLYVGLTMAVAGVAAPETTADFIVVEEASYTGAVRESAWSNGKELYVWTVNDSGAIRNMLRDNVDGIITDHPDAALSAREAMGPDERMSSKLYDALMRFVVIF